MSKKNEGAEKILREQGARVTPQRVAILQAVESTGMIARFSTVAGELGAADAERDVRGFALKFYTEEGNWDMVGNNTPVFFVRDPYKFPDFIHTQKRHPKTNLRSNAAAWDFWSLSPESLPVNAPKCPMNHYHKDGQMRFFPNFPNPDAYYEPNSFKGPVESPDFAEPPLKISADAGRYNHREGNDDYLQPRALFKLFDKGQKDRLFSNIAESMQGVPDSIVNRQLGHFEKVHPDYAAGVRAALAKLAKREK